MEWNVHEAKKRQAVERKWYICDVDISHIWLISSCGLPVPRASQIDAKLNILMVKRENVIPQRLSEFMMHQHIFSKWTEDHFSSNFYKTNLLKKGYDMTTSQHYSLSQFCPNNQRLCFHFTGTNFHLWIVPDSPAKTLIESFVGDPKAFGFFILPFARRMELWKAGKYKSLTIEKSP